MSFAKRLKDARMAKGVKRESLGEMVNKSARAVKAWELGQNVPTIETRRKIERSLGLPYGYLNNDYDKELCDVLSQFNLIVQNLDPVKRQHIVRILKSSIQILK
ncbi:helix-turn-helix domain-containing protein [Marinomonas sp. BSi20584]|uniref:helix-turn-helix domain-containing protein n=1 Tax=Marinomonas sp. BSi20584 TaxID=1594462 RepID=UPI000C1E5942|nr:helix-turn-helix domain-containing protein [Marinomonas sp. BSi20584]PJE55657.1 hypothetical protein TY87_09375 [Marinomonas sp. BSi20584]